MNVISYVMNKAKAIIFIILISRVLFICRVYVLGRFSIISFVLFIYVIITRTTKSF